MTNLLFTLLFCTSNLLGYYLFLVPRWIACAFDIARKQVTTFDPWSAHQAVANELLNGLRRCINTFFVFIEGYKGRGGEKDFIS
jgi:hypothetical protein